MNVKQPLTWLSILSTLLFCAGMWYILAATISWLTRSRSTTEIIIGRIACAGCAAIRWLAFSREIADA